MNIKTITNFVRATLKNSRKSGVRKHRHFVVLPLFLLLIALSAWKLTTMSHADVRASAVTETESDGVHLIQGKGEITLRIGQFQLMGFAGAFSVISTDTSLTVAGITSPVVVVSGDERVIVPVGMQWRIEKDASLPSLEEGRSAWLKARQFSVLPDDFYAKELGQLSRDTMSASGSSISETVIPSQDSLRFFAGAKERAELQEGKDLFGNLLEALAAGNDAQVAELFTHPLLLKLLGLPETADEILSLLADTSIKPSIAARLLPFVIHDQDFWLLASFHPRLREAAWSLAAPQELDTEHKMLRLFMVPASDVLPQETPPFIVDRWGETAVDEMHVKEDSGALLSDLIASQRGSLERLKRGKYPERLNRYSLAIEQFARGNEALLSKEASSVLSWAKGLDQVSFTQEDDVGAQILPASSTSSSSSSTGELFDGRVTEQEARKMLEDTGALFTLKTQIRAIAPATVTLVGIYFASEHADRSFNFKFNTQTKVVSEIMEGDQTMPYSLGLDAFVKWVRGE